MKTSTKILYIIFYITVIPTIFIYLAHAFMEGEGYEKSMKNGDGYKATKQFGETVLFSTIGVGYIVFASWILNAPKDKIPYIVLIVGTIAVIILYHLRIYGIPVVGTDVVIRDISADTFDVITKICQSIMLPVLTALLFLRKQ